MKTKKIVFSLLTVLIGIILLIPFITTIRMSMIDYRPASGISFSPDVGFEHYKAFFSSPYFGNVFSNSLSISCVSLLIGAVYTFFASSAITATKNNILRFLLTFVFCIPALIPGVLISNMLVELWESPLLARFLLSVFDGLRLSSFVVFASGFANGKPWKEGFKFALVFVSVRLITIFTTDTNMISLIYNPSNYESLDTLNTHVYRQGLMSSSWSYSSAVDVVRTLCQLIPATIGCIILIFMFKKKNDPVQETNSGWTAASVMAIIPAVILIALLITGSSLFPAGGHEIIYRGYVNEFIITFLSAFLATGIAYGISMICREANRIIGMIVLSIAILTTGCLVTDYLNVRDAGLLDSYLGVVMMNMSIVPVLAIVFTFISKDISGVKKHFALIISGFAFSFTWFWGETLSPSILLRDRETYPLSLVIRQIRQSHIVQAVDSMQVDTFETAPLSSLLYILIPLLIASAGILVGQLLLKSKRKNINMQSNYNNYPQQ